MGDLAKLIAAKDFKKLPNVQKIAKSGHTAQKLKFDSNHFSANELDDLCACYLTCSRWAIEISAPVTKTFTRLSGYSDDLFCGIGTAHRNIFKDQPHVPNI